MVQVIACKGNNHQGRTLLNHEHKGIPCQTLLKHNYAYHVNNGGLDMGRGLHKL